MQHEDKVAQRKYRAAQKEDKNAKLLRQFAIRELLKTPQGRELLWWLLEIGKYGTSPFTPDPQVTAFNCGEQNVGNRILAEIVETEPAGFVQLMQERQNVRSDPEPNTQFDPSGADADPDA
jgi:hypothetical protein